MPPIAVAIIVPMRNEENLVEGLVASVAAQDYEGETQLIIADGASTDSSVSRARSAALAHGINLLLVDNPRQRTASGLNSCIERAEAELLVRMDCHARFAPDYVSWCVRTSVETGAENVGGPTLVAGETRVERAVACAMTSPFGGIGWYREGAAIRHEHDTVYCGAFIPSVFGSIGGFDESLGSNEDDELNLRLRKAGGRVVLDRRIRLWYTPRARLRDVFTQYYRYGLWKPPVMLGHRSMLGARSLVPAIFVLTLAALAVSSFFSPPAGVLLASVVALYTGSGTAFAVRAIRARQESLRLLPATVGAFAAFHLGYGLGLLAGVGFVAVGKGRLRPAPTRAG